MTHRFAVDIPAAVGGPTAFVGFTAGTGELFARQSIDSWTFAEVVPDMPTSRPPEITTPAGATPVPEDLTVALTVGAADDGGPDGLTYTWEAVSAPSPPLITTQSVNHAAAAAALYADGTYTFRVTVRDAEGQTATSEVSYANQAGVSRLEVSPRQATIPAGGTAQFTAVAYDPSGQPVPAPAPVTWGVSQGPGTIDSTGLYTAPANEGGAVTIQAGLWVPIAPNAFRILSDEVAGWVEYTPPDNRPPEIPDPISVSFVTPSLVAFSAHATDDGGTAALTYAWEVVSAPAGSTPRLTQWQPTPSMAMFSPDRQAHFVVRVTVTDAQGLAATRTVGFDPPVTILDLHSPLMSLPVPGTMAFPQEATVPPGGTVQFGVDLRDPAGNRLPDPAPLWRVFAGPGTIDSAGLYTAPLDATGTGGSRPRSPTRAGRRPSGRGTRPTPSSSPRGRSGRGWTSPPGSPGPSWPGAGRPPWPATGCGWPRPRSRPAAPSPRPRSMSAASPRRSGSRSATRPTGGWGDGLTFVLQNADPRAVGAAGGGLGYQGITDSVAVKFDLVDNAGEGVDSVGVFTGGAEPTGPAVSLGGTGLQLHSGHVFRADLRYGAGTLVLDLRDTSTGQEFTTAFPVDIRAAVGGSTAYAGFTAGTGELFAPIDVLGWTYTPTPYATGNTPPFFADAGTPPTETVRGRYTIFTGLAQDNGGPYNLWYTWETVSAPAGAAPVRFETSGPNSGHTVRPGRARHGHVRPGRRVRLPADGPGLAGGGGPDGPVPGGRGPGAVGLCCHPGRRDGAERGDGGDHRRGARPVRRPAGGDDRRVAFRARGPRVHRRGQCVPRPGGLGRGGDDPGDERDGDRGHGGQRGPPRGLVGRRPARA